MTNKEALIHLRVPAATKGRWIRASRARSMKLTDYIVEAVESKIMKDMVTIAIPDDLEFTDLNLERHAGGDVSVDMSVVKRICSASQFPVELITDSEENLAALIVEWYLAHIQQGGQPHPVAEELLSEVEIEERAGQKYSFPPGNA